MRFTIIIPHYKAGKITAYCVAQILKFTYEKDIDIVVVDNNVGDGSTQFLDPFLDNITIVEYPKTKLQSHGIAIDHIVPHIKTDWFIPFESDAFPTKYNWLDYYRAIIHEGYDAAGSLLKLSGGTYVHPCGAMYSKKLWQEAKEYCDKIPFNYYPNMHRKDGFDYHLMVHPSVLTQVLEEPDDWIELSSGYRPYNKWLAEDRRTHYFPVVAPFHNGMGGNQESIHTYGERAIESDAPHILVSDKNAKLIDRVGYEPGQWLTYWMAAMGKKVFHIPTEVKWLPGKENQQQEYTLNEAFVKHVWAISSYHGVKSEDPVAQLKQDTEDALYDSLPNHQKI